MVLNLDVVNVVCLRISCVTGENECSAGCRCRLEKAYQKQHENSARST